jgi:HEAT repeat protein
MKWMDAVLWLAALLACGGLVPLAYVLTRQLRDRRTRKKAAKRLQQAQAALAGGTTSDVTETVKALAAFDADTLDSTIESLTTSDTAAERLPWIAQLAIQLGVFDRARERARNDRTWSRRGHAVRLLGRLGLSAAVPTLASVLRDVYEDESVRRLAADALAEIRDPSAVPLLIGELRAVDELATPRVVESLIRFGNAATPGLIELLELHEHTPARVWAARILISTRDVRAVEALLARLRDRHDALRAASAEALGMIGDQRALQLLMQVALRDPAPLVRAQAAAAVARIAGEEASDVLIAALGDSDYATRLRALEAFESMRLMDTSPLEKALHDPNAEVRRRAAQALERLGYLDRLVTALGSEDRKARATAHAGLLQLGRAGLIEGIAGRIRHESMLVRVSIARLCGELRAERAGPALIAALDDPAWPVRATLCEAIGELRPKGGGSALMRLLTDPEESVREAAANALAAYAGSEVEGGHLELVTAYESGSIPIRLSMIAVAACIDDPALSAILVEAMRDPSEAVRMRAVGALAARPNQAAIPALIGALTDASIDVRLAAVPALGAAGTAEAFEALLGTLAGAQPAMRERIAEALSGVGRHHLLRNIEELARSELLDVRLGVAWTLGKIGDAVGVPVLSEFLHDKDARLRASAAGALGKIPGAQTVAVLLAASADRDPKTRAAVANALGKCGAGHVEVCESLKGRLHDPDRFVRNRAAIALARVAGPSVAALACAPATALLVDDAALVMMQGLIGTDETVALALQALSDPLRLKGIQQFFDREESAICSAFLSSLNLSDPGSLGLRSHLDPAALVAQYEKLLRSSQDTKERRAAIEALAGIKGDGQVPAFADALSADPDDTVRMRAAEVLAQRVENETARDALVRAIGDPNSKVAVAAIQGLRSRREPAVISAMFRRLGAGSPAVNQAIELALAEMHEGKLTAFIDRTMGADRPFAIVAAIRVLEVMAHPSAMPLLTELLKSETPEVRAASVRAIAKTGLPEATRAIGRMLNDPHETVRMATLEIMAEQGLSAVMRLAAACVDPSAAVRCRLCQLLERLPSNAASKVLDRLLEDASPKVRGAALMTLLAFGDPQSMQRFAACLDKATPETLEELRSEARAETVTHALGKSLASGADSAAREPSVIAIAALAVEGYEQYLLPVLRDPRSAVRLRAASALASSDVPEVRRRVRELLEDPELAVREVARSAVARDMS